jgi:hypothetical protein
MPQYYRVVSVRNELISWGVYIIILPSFLKTGLILVAIITFSLDGGAFDALIYTSRTTEVR